MVAEMESLAESSIEETFSRMNPTVGGGCLLAVLSLTWDVRTAITQSEFDLGSSIP
jgi:hypothetical protein